MIVLRGATSQRNRPRDGSAPIDLASGPPLQTAGMTARFARTASRSTVGSTARSSDSSTSMRASRKFVSAHDRMTPTLIFSPRSTRGTTRMIA